VSEWQTDEDITAAKLNQKEVYIGSSAPSNPTDGQLWFDTVNRKLKYYDANAATWRVVPRVLTDLESRLHADLQNVGTDDHHPKIHGHAEHSFGEAEVVANKGAANGYAGLTSLKTLPVEYFEAEYDYDTLQHSNDAEKSTTSLDAVKLKETKLLTKLRGSICIKFDMRSGTGGGTVYAEIRRNGVAISDTFSYNDINYHTFTLVKENIEWDENDLIQIYAWKSLGSAGVFVKNFRFYFHQKKHEFSNQDP